jgi:peroxiredoxin 2/4
MKTPLIFLVITFLSIQHNLAKAQEFQNGPRTSGRAPSFTAVSTQGEINFPNDYFGKWKILFSHPADFTPVCTTEILALAEAQDDFKDLKTNLIVISTDGLNSHIEWVKSMESIAAEGMNPVKIDFPLIADTDLKVSRLYGLLQPGKSERDIRGVVFIDPDNEIRAFFHYPETIGRNIEEIKRTLIAMQTQDSHDVLTPANWQPGDEVLISSPASIKDAERLERRNNPKLRKAAWYLWYKTL